VHKVHKLGRIISVEISLGGRYNSELGLLLTMGAGQHNGQLDSSWTVTSFDSVPHHFMSKDEGNVAFLVSFLAHLMNKADVTKISELVNKPVLCEFKEGELTSWSLWDQTV